MMKRTRRRMTVGLATGALVVAGITGGVLTASSHDNEEPITGDALVRATGAALEHVGEGRVTETEVDDEDSKYEVEIRRPDGTQVDVQLDENFNVVGTEDDGLDDEAGDSDD